MELERKTVAQLRDELKSAGLATSGKKAELVGRLREHLKAASSSDGGVCGVVVEAGAWVCEGCILEGDVVISRGCVVHPGAVIRGRVRLGRGCVVEEGARLEQKGAGIKAGEGNMFQAGCRVGCEMVGDYNVFMPKCELGKGVKVGSGCTVGALVSLADSSLTIPDGSAVAIVGGSSEGEPSSAIITHPPHAKENNRASIEAIIEALSEPKGGKNRSYLGHFHKFMAPSGSSEAIS